MNKRTKNLSASVSISEEDKLALIQFHLAFVPFDKDAIVEKDGVVVRATTGELVEPTTDPALGVQVCPGYREKIHRVKFALAHGYLPVQVDHADGNRQNNRLNNLRAATAQQSAWNTGPRKRKEPHLPRCVYARPSKSKGWRYQAKVWTNDGWRSLGTYDSPKEASEVAEAYLRELHGVFYRSHSPDPLKEGGEGEEPHGGRS
jgi:hypothetical protein